MAKRTRAYIDTSAFISFLDASDHHNSRFVRLFSNPPAILTTPLVIAEGHAWFLRRFSVERALEFLNFIGDLKPLEIVAVGKAEVGHAVKYAQKFSDQDLTICDAVGLWLMDSLRINECWSTDRHLGLTGKRLAIY